MGIGNSLMQSAWRGLDVLLITLMGIGNLDTLETEAIAHNISLPLMGIGNRSGSGRACWPTPAHYPSWGSEPPELR